MMKRRRALNSSQAPSPEGSEDDEAKSPVSNDDSDGGDSLKRSDTVRGRKSKTKERVEDFVREEFRRDPLDLVH